MEYYHHKSTGVIDWNPGLGTKRYEPHWAILRCDQGIVDYYAWWMKRCGRTVEKNMLWKAHVSFIKGDAPTAGIWGKNYGDIEFNYAHIVRWDNNFHSWVDVWCPKLHEIRADLGLPPKTKMSFHMTIGRLI